MTDPEQRAHELFQQALDRPTAERPAFLDDACAGDSALRAEVDSLLAALADAEDFLAEPTRPMAGGEAAGEAIDRYKLLQQIGEGGFGVVWMAEQIEPVRRKVALKIIKRGMDTRQVVARFEAERQALAMMDHPNIARVFDGGSTASGRPYFVMELVRGMPITEFCDHANLTPTERMQLFQRVCQAVQHAHQKGVIHRDLKPSNVLVTLHDGTPVPKVIDFGIAKATSQELTQRTLFTEFRQMIGTPEYMAPEQAELSGLDVDTRADVYSLGVLLYELLTGTKPFDATELRQRGYDEILRQIREVDPPKPSTRLSTLGDALASVARRRQTDPDKLGRLLRGDVDWIVMKALEKERGRRYATASALAEDLQRHLDDLPVEASPPDAFYRVAKFVRRNTGLVLAVTAVFTALLAGVVGVGMALRRALAAEQRSRTAAARANTVLDFTQEMLASATPHESKAPDYTLRQLLDDYDRSLGDRLRDQPEVDAAIRATIGSAYRSLGELDKAQAHLQRALDARKAARSDDPDAYAVSLGHWALLLHDRGDYAGAERAAAEALAIDREHGDAAAVATRLLCLADVRRHQGRPDDAERDAREAQDLVAGLPAGSRPGEDAPLNELGSIATARGRYAEAEQLHRRALELLRAAHGPEHPAIARTLHNLAANVRNQGRVAEAEPLQREALAMSRKLVGDAHPVVGIETGHLATMVEALGHFEEAEQLQRQALAILENALGDDHPDVATTLNNLAVLLDRGPRSAEAERLYRRALAIRRAHLPSPHAAVAQSLFNLAFCLNRLQRDPEAIPLLREGIQILQAVHGERHQLTGEATVRLAAFLHATGQHTEAERTAREALTILDAAAPESHLRWTASRTIGTALTAQGRFAEAEPWLRAVRDHASSPAASRRALTLLVDLHTQWNQEEPTPERQQTLAALRTELQKLDNEGKDK